MGPARTAANVVQSPTKGTTGAVGFRRSGGTRGRTVLGAGSGNGRRTPRRVEGRQRQQNYRKVLVSRNGGQGDGSTSQGRARREGKIAARDAGAAKKLPTRCKDGPGRQWRNIERATDKARVVRREPSLPRRRFHHQRVGTAGDIRGRNAGTVNAGHVEVPAGSYQADNVYTNSVVGRSSYTPGAGNHMVSEHVVVSGGDATSRYSGRGPFAAPNKTPRCVWRAALAGRFGANCHGRSRELLDTVDPNESSVGRVCGDGRRGGGEPIACLSPGRRTGRPPLDGNLEALQGGPREHLSYGRGRRFPSWGRHAGLPEHEVNT